MDDARVMPAAELLADFFLRQPAESLDRKAYVERFRDESAENGADILAHVPQASRVVRETVGMLSRFLEERVLRGRVIEGHGDLRPEHIFLGPPPAVIDCLELERRFRILDPVQEVAIPSLECERLEAPRLGALLLRVYCSVAQDLPPEQLVRFYAAHYGLLRAKIAVWHLATTLRIQSVGSASARAISNRRSGTHARASNATTRASLRRFVHRSPTADLPPAKLAGGSRAPRRR